MFSRQEQASFDGTVDALHAPSFAPKYEPWRMRWTFQTGESPHCRLLHACRRIPCHVHHHHTAPSIDSWLVSSLLSTPLAFFIAPFLHLHQASPTPPSSSHRIASIQMVVAQRRAAILSPVHNTKQESHHWRIASHRSVSPPRATNEALGVHLGIQSCMPLVLLWIVFLPHTTTSVVVVVK